VNAFIYYIYGRETGEESEIWYEKERRREKAHKEPRKRENGEKCCFLVVMQFEGRR
jgi:hypothetical protein